MSEKYFIDKAGNSRVKISDEVITKIALEAATRVDGVVSHQNTKKDAMRDILHVMNNNNKLARVTSDELQSVIDVSITVEYGKNILDVAEEVQKKVKESIENMTDINIVSVNVHVNGIRMRDGEQTSLNN